MAIEINDDTLQFADNQVICTNRKEDLIYMTRKLKEAVSYTHLSSLNSEI